MKLKAVSQLNAKKYSNTKPKMERVSVHVMHLSRLGLNNKKRQTESNYSEKIAKKGKQK
jgi:hypothetical protein